MGSETVTEDGEGMGEGLQRVLGIVQARPRVGGLLMISDWSCLILNLALAIVVEDRKKDRRL